MPNDDSTTSTFEGRDVIELKNIHYNENKEPRILPSVVTVNAEKEGSHKSFRAFATVAYTLVVSVASYYVKWAASIVAGAYIKRLNIAWFRNFVGRLSAHDPLITPVHGPKLTLRSLCDNTFHVSRRFHCTNVREASTTKTHYHNCAQTTQRARAPKFSFYATATGIARAATTTNS